MMMHTQALNLKKQWDKTFPKSEKVEHEKVTFINRYGLGWRELNPNRFPSPLFPKYFVKTA